MPCSSSLVLLPPRCFRISWLCMQLIQHIKNSSQLETSTRLLMFWHPFLRSIAQTPTKRNNRHQLKLSKRLLQTWNGLLRKRSLLLLWKQMYGVFAALSFSIQQATLSLHISWSQSRPKQKTTMEKHTGSTAQRRRRLTKRSTFSL